MRKSVDLLKRWARDESGTAMIEYSILLGLIAAATITAVVAVGGWTTGKWGTLCGALGVTCT